MNKLTKISFIYILIIIFLLSLLSAFIFGVKVGHFRESPAFDVVYNLYNYATKFRSNIYKTFNKKKIQIIREKKTELIEKKSIINNDSLMTSGNLSIYFSGAVPKDIIIAASVSLLEDEILNHYLLFLRDKKIIHSVLLDENKKFQTQDNLYKLPHGLIISKKHEIYYNFDGGNSLVKKSICGDRIWDIKGKYHHLMSINEDINYLWTLKKINSSNSSFTEIFAKIDAGNGEILDSFNVDDLIKANAPNDYFSIKQRDLSSIWEYEPFHFNDVDVLNKKLSSYFSEFSEGDLMISSRSLNLIFIVDPISLKIKDLFFGKTRRQHDPDWNRGYITIYDNQTEWGINKQGKELRYSDSRIIKIDYNNKKKISTLKFDDEFISDARGNYDMSHLKDNNKFHLIVSPYEGNLSLYKNNKQVFKLINEHVLGGLSVSNAKILTDDNLIEKINSCKK